MMAKLKLSATFLIAALLFGCSGAQLDAPILYQYTDNVVMKRIDLRFENLTGETICMTTDDWPNEAGKLDSMGGLVSLVVSGKRFLLIDSDVGYCSGQACVRRVRAGEKTEGYLSYDDFSLPPGLYDELKVLEFTPVAYYC